MTELDFRKAFHYRDVNESHKTVLKLIFFLIWGNEFLDFQRLENLSLLSSLDEIICASVITACGLRLIS